MDFQMNDFLERQRLMEEKRRILIAHQDMRLKQVITREAKRHTAQAEEYLMRELYPLTIRVDNMHAICQKLEQNQQTLANVYSSVCGGDLQGFIVRLKCEANDNRVRNKSITIEKRKSILQRANNTLKRNPKICQLNMFLRNVGNSKAELDAIDGLANNENAQIQKEGEMERNDIKKEERSIQDLNESIRQTEQQLQQLENGDEAKASPQKPAIETAVPNVRPKTPAKVQIEEDEDFVISPIKIVEMDHASRAKPNAPTVPALNNMYGSRAYGSGSGSNHRVPNAPAMMMNAPNIAQNSAHGSGSSNNYRASGTSHMMANVPPNAKQPGIDSHRSGAQDLSASTKDPRIRAMAPKPPAVNQGQGDMTASMRQNWQNDHTKSRYSDPGLAEQNPLTTGSINAQSNRGQSNDPGSSHRAPDGMPMMVNAPNTSDTRLQPQTPKAPSPGNQTKQNASPFGSNNAQSGRAQDSGTSNMVTNAPNNGQNERTLTSGLDNNRRSNITGVASTAPYNAMQQGYDNRYSTVQNLPTATNDARQQPQRQPQPQTPKAPSPGNQKEDLNISPVKVTQTEDLHRRELQVSSAFGPNNVQSGRAQGSDNSYRTRDSSTANMMSNAPNNMQNERAHGIGFGNNRRVVDVPSAMMTNAPYNTTQPGHGNRSGMQNLSTVTNDPRMRAKTPHPPTVHNDNQHIDHTNSRVIEQTPVKQNAPPGGLNNVRDSRAQGSGSGGNYRTSDTSSAMVNNPHTAKRQPSDGQFSGRQKMPTAMDDRSMHRGMKPPRFEKEQNYSSTSSNSNDMPTARSMQQSSNDFNRIPRVTPQKSTEPSSSIATAPKPMPAESSFGDSFLEPDLPALYAQKRKGEPNQKDGAKKSRENAFMDKSSHSDGSGKDQSNSKMGRSPGGNSEDSFSFSFAGDGGADFMFDTSNDENPKKTKTQGGKADNDDLSFGMGLDFSFEGGTNLSGGTMAALLDEFDPTSGFD